jgi:hypothetical protein
VIDFEPTGHTYSIAGRRIPGVTSVIEPLERFIGVDPAVLEYASERGRAVHLACDLVDEDDLDREALDPVLVPYVEAYERFRSELRPEWEAVEQVVYSERYGYAGRLDRAGCLYGIKNQAPRVVLDIKTVAALSPVTGLQLAAYAEAYDPDRRRTPPRRFALQIKPDGTYRLQEYRERSDLSVFLAQLTIAGWCRRHNRTQEIAA